MTATGLVMQAYGNPAVMNPANNVGGVVSWSPYRMRFFPSADKPPWTGSRDEAAQIIKRFSIDIGVPVVGIGPFEQRFVYSREVDSAPIEFSDTAENPHAVMNEAGRRERLIIPTKMQYAVSILQSMPHNMVACSPEPIGASVSQLSYSEGMYHAAMIAEFIRALGYNAVPLGPNPTAMRIPVAIAAGLGEMGRNGLLINPQLGAAIRIATIFTDLPMTFDRPIDFGIRKFCEKCFKCAVHCPAQAISYGPETYEGPTISSANGTKKWYIDAEKCHLYWQTISSTCLNCIRVCAYNKPPGHWTHDPFGITLAPILGGGIMSTLDDWMGYGRQLDQADYWKIKA
jgi:reductive dehalogenase